MSFDPGDKRNGSLYVCEPAPGGKGCALLIGKLRALKLWSDAEPKQVHDDQKEAYKAQLQFAAAQEYSIAGDVVVLVRCDHPKFRSDSERWRAWNAAARSLSIDAAAK